MSYKEKIAELSKFFSTVKSIRDKYVREYYGVFENNPNIQKLKDYYYIGDLTPKYFVEIQIGINILEIDNYSESLNNYNKYIDIYSIRNAVLHEKSDIGLYPLEYPLNGDILFILNLVLNYNKLKYVVRPKDWRIIAKLMNTFFGDMR